MAFACLTKGDTCRYWRSGLVERGDGAKRRSGHEIAGRCARIIVGGANGIGHDTSVIIGE